MEEVLTQVWLRNERDIGQTSECINKKSFWGSRKLLEAQKKCGMKIKIELEVELEKTMRVRMFLVEGRSL